MSIINTPNASRSPMGRDFRINGESLVKVKGGAHYSGGPIAVLSELGLTGGPVHVSLIPNHIDVKTDGYGSRVPAEVLWDLAEVRIKMDLVHYDPGVLDICVDEAMVGLGSTGNLTAGPFAGYMAPAGMPMGAGKAIFNSGNHFISLSVTSPVLRWPWRFRACYLTEHIEYPLGTQYSQVQLTWRAIPYSPPNVFVNSGQVSSSGVCLWDHEQD